MKGTMLNSLKKHNKKTFEKYFEDYKSLVYLGLKKYCYNENIYEDVAAEALLQLYKSLDKFDPSQAKFTTFVVGIVKNLAFKKYQRTPSVNDVLCSTTIMDTFQDTSRGVFKLSSIKRFVTDEEYEFLFEIYALNYSIKEVASKRNMNYSTAKYHHKQLLEKLRSYLEVYKR